MYNPYELLRRPHITEKGSAAAGELSRVVFEVPVDANKVQIKKAIQHVFNVEVSSVKTMIVRGKLKRRGKTVGKRPNWKKAIVTLKAGFEIDFFGGGTMAS
ncbi:MAG: 50S ribosomal protein L23 [Deltaproteobacteria bacterium]|nr:50S ribosomal protein L23 [Deltaproteobacteria bacterium]